MIDLAHRTASGELPTLAQIRKLSDEEVVERLTVVRGIGPWTVHMFLMFRLGRPDVLPVADYGVRKGFALTYRKKDLPTAGRAHEARGTLAAVPVAGELVHVAGAGTVTRQGGRRRCTTDRSGSRSSR